VPCGARSPGVVGHDVRIPTPCPTAAGIWPHRAVQPTVGATTTSCLPNSCRRRVRRQRYISRNFLFNYLFFENQSEINIKNPLFPFTRGSRDSAAVFFGCGLRWAFRPANAAAVGWLTYRFVNNDAWWQRISFQRSGGGGSNSGARRSAGVRLRPRAEGGGPASAMEGEEEEGTGQGLAGAGHGRGRASIGGGAAGAESTAALASGWIRPRARVRPWELPPHPRPRTALAGPARRPTNGNTIALLPTVVNSWLNYWLLN
jgi:hypothetical protein